MPNTQPPVNPPPQPPSTSASPAVSAIVSPAMQPSANPSGSLFRSPQANQPQTAQPLLNFVHPMSGGNLHHHHHHPPQSSSSSSSILSFPSVQPPPPLAHLAAAQPSYPHPHSPAPSPAAPLPPAAAAVASYGGPRSNDGAGGGSTNNVSGMQSPSAPPPCRHNNWDNLRAKNSVVTLCCRDCQSKWKLQFPIRAMCVEFHQCMSCAFGVSCPYLHVHRFKSIVKSPNPVGHVTGAVKDPLWEYCAREVLAHYQQQSGQQVLPSMVIEEVRERYRTMLQHQQQQQQQQQPQQQYSFQTATPPQFIGAPIVASPPQPTAYHHHAPLQHPQPPNILNHHYASYAQPMVMVQWPSGAQAPSPVALPQHHQQQQQQQQHQQAVYFIHPTPSAGGHHAPIQYFPSHGWGTM
jgi:hypothetical protein